MGTALTLFTLTFAIAAGFFFYTKLKADRAESEHRHFGGTPHRSVFGDLDMGMSARERLDQRSSGPRFKRERTQAILREEREKTS